MTQSKKLFPLFLTNDLAPIKEFYIKNVGFNVAIDMENYLQVRLGDEDGPELCFMKRDAFPDGIIRPAFGGEGVIVSVPVENADATYEEVNATGAKLMGPPTDKPWGWRSFMVQDPCGVVLDFFHVKEDVAKKM